MPHQPVPYGKDDLLRDMDAAGVDRAILVPPSWEGERNDLVIEAARLHPDRFGVMGRFDSEASDAANQLARWKEQPEMLGLRFTFRRPQLAAPLVEGWIDWVWAAAEKHSLPVMVMVSQKSDSAHRPHRRALSRTQVRDGPYDVDERPEG
jgi:L-fuconolactonase